MMNGKQLFRVGVVGSTIAAICCATPILSIILGIVGLGVLTKYLDSVLIPALGVFIFLALVGWWLAQRNTCAAPTPSGRPDSGGRDDT